MRPMKGAAGYGKGGGPMAKPDMMVVSSNPRLSVDASANSGSAYLASTYDHGQDLRAITDKISRVSVALGIKPSHIGLISWILCHINLYIGDVCGPNINYQ